VSLVIVPLPVARKLIAGKATQIRVPATTARCPFRVGSDYTIRPQRVDLTEQDGKTIRLASIGTSIGRVQILNTVAARLGDLTFDDARREGFHTRDEYRAAWALHRGHGDDDTRVWVLTVKPHHDTIRLLAPSGSQARHSELDYTADRSQAMREEPEAVDAATLAAFTSTARANDTRRAGDAVNERVERVMRDIADLLGPIASDDTKVIRRRIEAGLAKRKRNAA
jgi:hypothetical protein